MGAGGNAPVMLVLGDSVAWGQGLQEWNKYATLVFDQLKNRPEYAGLTLAVRARSGAIIGNGKPPSPRNVPPEVPWNYPTILQQCDAYVGDPDAVRVVLMDGGINDVTVDAIVNPNTTIEDLKEKIEQYCHLDMRELLQKVSAKFSNPACRIIVTGYYQILSAASSVTPTIQFLKIYGIAEAARILARGTAFSDLIALSATFWTESDKMLELAVNEANAQAGNRITFVRSGFTKANSLFQPGSLLWIFSGVPPFVDAADDFGNFRAQVCPNYYPNDTVGCAVCRFASVGHPTANGAIKYYQQIMQAFP